MSIVIKRADYFRGWTVFRLSEFFDVAKHKIVEINGTKYEMHLVHYSGTDPRDTFGYYVDGHVNNGDVIKLLSETDN